jgi:tetratricopeptide (TPR) repeat protein
LGYLDRSDELIHKCLATLDSDELTEQDTRFEKALAFLCLSCVMDLKNVPQDETKHFVEEAVEMIQSLEEPWWVSFVLFTSAAIVRFSDLEENENFFEKSFTTQRALGDLRGMADSLEFWSWFFAGRLQFEKAEALLNEALAISREMDDRHKVVSLCGVLGWQWIWQSRFEEARTLYTQTLAKYSDLDYSQSEAILLHAHLGYPNLYLGEYEAARNKAQYAIELLSQSNHFNTDLWTAYCKDIFGKAALAEGSFSEAEAYFKECQMVFQNYNHREKISTNLACLGYIARAHNQINKAQRCFFQALDMGHRVIMCLPHILPGIALLFADLGESERAVEIYSFASTMGWVANSKWFDDIAGVQIRAFAGQLAPEVTKAAQKSGTSLELWEGTEQLLVELEALGWGCAGQ